MDITALRAAYDRLLTAADAIRRPARLTAGQRADTDWTLCHVYLSDHLLTGAARSLLTGMQPVIDNLPAMEPARIAAAIAASTHEQRTGNLRRNAATLLELLTVLPDSAARAPVQLRLHDRTGHHLGDSELTWGELIRLRAHEHIPGHAARLAGYLSETT